MKVEITVAETAGFCFGVSRAVAAAEKLADEEGCGVTLGQLIHNDDVTRSLAKKGISVAEKLEDCGDKTVIIRSHGVPQSVYDELERRGLKYVDATCPYVRKIHRLVRENTENGNTVVIIGDHSHPEVEGIVGHAFPGAENRVFVAADKDELGELLKSKKIHRESALILVAQTTYNRAKWQICKDFAKKYYTKVQFFDTICSATTNRQQEAASLAEKSDLMIVLGAFHSSNSAKLAEICREKADTLFLENAEGLDPDYVKRLIWQSGDDGCFKIGITAGASTPADIIKEVHSIMSETIKNDDMDIDFMAEVDKTFKRVYIGNRVKAYVVAVNNTEAVVDIGTKHSGYIPAEELSANPNLKPSDVVKVGDEIECVVTAINDAEGTVTLSKKKIDAALGIEKIANASETNETLEGVVTAVVKGGVIVTCEGARVFVPASQTGVPRTGKLEDLLKKTVKFKILEMNEAKNRVVGSIKNALKAETDALKAKFWSEIEVGKKFVGEVKSMESYGVFVDLGGVDGMVHLSELTWNRIKHPKEIVSIGDKLAVYVKSFDPEKRRVSLGAKDPNDNPWTKFLADFNIGDVVEVQIVSITPFGAFAQIIPGVDGLIHISQIALERITNVSQVLSVGQMVQAKITDIDTEKSRVSLSMKVLLEEAQDAQDDADQEETSDEQ